MNILFRLDYNNDVGFGHISRCFLIARYMSKNFNTNIFLSRNSINKKNRLVKESLNYKSKKFSYKYDLSRTINFIKKKNIDLVILDNYDCGKNWCSQIKKQNKKLVIIDDGLKKNFKADLYLNYNLSNRNSTKEKLLGYKFFPIDKKYINLKSRRSNLRYDIFLNLGSGNFKKHNKILVNFLFNLDFIRKIVVIGDKIQGIDNNKTKIKYIKNYRFLGTYIKNSRICIGAGGVNLIERLFLQKKKNIVFSTAKHQETICKFMSQSNYIKYYGPVKLINQKKIIESLKSEIIKIFKNEKKI